MTNTLNCFQHGTKQYYLGLKDNSINEDVRIVNIDVFGETNGYVFSKQIINDNTLKRGGELYDFSIKLINSPTIICNKSYIKITFGVTFSINGEEYYEEITNTNSGENIIYSGSDVLERGYSANKIKLDSFYRPFFFNAVLLLLPQNFNKTKTTVYNSRNAYGRLYYSIANGCTYRQYDGNINRYMMGDIDIKLDHSTSYVLNIKKSYRDFSEIEYVPISGITFERHISGIRESGIDNIVEIAGENGVITLERGINLTNDTSNISVYPQNEYNNSGTTKNVIYWNENGVKINSLLDINNMNNDNLYHIDTTSPLKLNMKVKDFAPLGYTPNIIEIDSGYVHFPDEIECKTGGNMFSISFSNKYSDAISYYPIFKTPIYNPTTNSYNLTINKLCEMIGNLNVNDGVFSDEKYKTIFEFLSGDKMPEFSFTQENDKLVGTINYQNNSGYDFEYVMAIYDGGCLKDENKTQFSYIKHTNKLLIIKLYRV